MNEIVHSFVTYHMLLWNDAEEGFTYGSQNQQMHVSLWTCVLYIVYLMQVSATRVAILREVRYNGWIYPAVSTYPYFVTHLPEESLGGILCV
jgi:hypothetical protein